jgi:hypothetical protein
VREPEFEHRQVRAAGLNVGSTLAATAANEWSHILTQIYVCAHIWRIFPFIGSSAENRGTPGITGSSIVHALCSLILLYMYVQISIISGSWP